MPWDINIAKELIKHYNVKKGITPSMLLKGMRVELEHSGGKFDVVHHNRYIVAKIALAHLYENKDYYKKLKKAKL